MKRIGLLLTLLIIAVGFTSCSSTAETVSPGIPEVQENDNGEPRRYAEIQFKVRVPAGVREETGVYLHLLDEVTGLMLNPVTYQFNRDGENVYVANIAVPVDSVIKYRYSLGESVADVEFTPMGQPVRYRMAHIHQPMQIEDTVASWGTDEYTGNDGRIEGTVLDESGKAVAHSLITVGGCSTYTNSDGSFVVNGVPVGTHNLLVYSPDGFHETFQQLATVGTGLKTLADIVVQESTFVKVNIHVRVPDDVFAQLPVRLVGNTLSTGNTFQDLPGGISAPAALSPSLNYLGGCDYIISLDLPVGFDFRYKFSHGDGFWNAEQSSSSRFLVRQLIVPATNLELYDTVESWNISDKAPLSIITTAPESTSADATVFIQFRPYDWMMPIPMWQIDEHRWLYVLTAPMEYFNGLNYRYCLDGDCENMPEVNEDQLLIQRKLEITLEPQNIEDVIMGWR